MTKRVYLFGHNDDLLNTKSVWAMREIFDKFKNHISNHIITGIYVSYGEFLQRGVKKVHNGILQFLMDHSYYIEENGEEKISINEVYIDYIPKTTIQPDVNKRAYFMWELSGKPRGRDLYFWFKAEKQIMDEHFKSNEFN